MMNDIDGYISSFPPEVQRILREVRKVISSTAVGARETISYGMPTFKMGENLVHFAAYKNHIGFYPTPSAILAFKKELAMYKSSKGAVQFPIDKPVPYDLIRLITEFRVKEVESKLR